MNKKQPITQIAGILLIVLAAATGLIMLSQASVGEAFAMFVRGIFGNKNSFFEIFVKATPLIFTSLGCAVAFRSGFFNIGAEGQLYVGALAAAMVALGLPEAAGSVRIPLAFLAGFIGGGVWCFLAAIVKEKLRISEIIVTIMLNYIGINLVGIAVRTFLMDPAGSIPQSAKIDPSAVLPLLMPPARLNAGFLAALAAVGIVRFLLEKTTLGFEIKAVGFNKRASACNGISTLKNIAAAAVLSGGLAGLAGVVELGVQEVARDFREQRQHRGPHRPAGCQQPNRGLPCRHRLCSPPGGRKFHAASAGDPIFHRGYPDGAGGVADHGQRTVPQAKEAGKCSITYLPSTSSLHC